MIVILNKFLWPRFIWQIVLYCVVKYCGGNSESLVSEVVILLEFLLVLCEIEEESAFDFGCGLTVRNKGVFTLSVQTSFIFENE